MSVATEFPPAVHIPDRARRSMPNEGVGSVRRHLAVVPVEAQPVVPQRLVVDRLPSRSPSGRFGQSALDWPLTVTPAAAVPLRLTRRGVAVLSMLTVVLGGLLLLVAHASIGSAPSTSAGQAAVNGPVTVQPGDTLWTIAQRLQPNRDPRQEVDHLRQLNQLGSVSLTPGQTLKVG